MIGLDTNVLLRCFVDDEPNQARRARQFVRDRCKPSDPGFVNRVVLCELIWVLSRGYHFGRAEIAAVVSSLLTSNDIVLEDSEQVRVALLSFQSGGLGFADALMGEVNRVHGCEATATFDRKAARLGGFVLV